MWASQSHMTNARTYLHGTSFNNKTTKPHPIKGRNKNEKKTKAIFWLQQQFSKWSRMNIRLASKSSQVNIYLDQHAVLYFRIGQIGRTDWLIERPTDWLHCQKKKKSYCQDELAITIGHFWDLFCDWIISRMVQHQAASKLERFVFFLLWVTWVHKSYKRQ